MAVVVGLKLGLKIAQECRVKSFLKDFSIFFEINKVKTLKEKALPVTVNNTGIIQAKAPFKKHLGKTWHQN